MYVFVVPVIDLYLHSLYQQNENKATDLLVTGDHSLMNNMILAP